MHSGRPVALPAAGVTKEEDHEALLAFDRLHITSHLNLRPNMLVNVTPEPTHEQGILLAFLPSLVVDGRQLLPNGLLRVGLTQARCRQTPPCF